MSEEMDNKYYAGDGTTVDQRKINLPNYRDINYPDHPEGYLAEKGLADAVNVALMLGQPLLVTGEPGTGKTQLARSIAYELGLSSPLTFHTKTTSAAKDLFYRYDALGHFHDAQFQNEALSAENYVIYEALGLAILLSMEPQEANPFLPPQLQNKGPIRSVVLIDEIDKAPRDLPNDVLNEIENLSFTVKETGKTFEADENYRPIVILTSNSEKNLPDAFLRRCVFYHIAFPEVDRLREIVARRLKLDSGFNDTMLRNALQHFREIRQMERLRKKPATAELLAWLRILERKRLDVKDANRVEDVASTYSILVKSKDDLELLLASLPGRPNR